MHDWDDAEVTSEQAALATAANKLHIQIQQRIRTASVLNGRTSFHEQLRPLYHRLAITEAQLWRHALREVAWATMSAQATASLLKLPCTEQTIRDIMEMAADVPKALSRLTSLQRDTMLTNPEIALANNIAMDCEAEFDNEEAFARWSKAAAGISR